MGSSNETSYYGDVINPWRPRGSQTALVPGGSSGGSATAVAGKFAMGATGTDTGGSIRQPGALTGIVGMKPTYGRCSRWGIVAFASSLDQAGPMTRSVRDSAIMLGAMAGFDAKDSTSSKRELPDFEAALSGDIRGLKVGIPAEYRVEGMPGEIDANCGQRGIGWLQADAGAEIIDVSLPHTQIRAARLLHHRPRRGLVQPGPLRRRALWPARAGRRTSIDMYESHPRPEGFGARKCAGAS